MGQGNKRFKIQALIQLAKITSDEELREQIVLEVQELIESVDCLLEKKEITFSEEIFCDVNDFLIKKDITCASEIWKEALGRSGQPKKWQSREINNIVASLDGWEKMEYPYKFAKYGNQRGFRRVLK